MCISPSIPSIDMALEESYWTALCAVAAAALLIHEVAITLAESAAFLQRARMTLVSVMFILNQIVCIALAASIVINMLEWTTNSSLIAENSLLGTCLIFSHFMYGVFSALRVYAVSGGEKLSVLAMLLLSLGSPVLQLYVTIVYAMTLTSSTDYSLLECTMTWLEAVKMTPMIVLDCVALVVTWRSTYRFKRAADDAKVKAPLTTLLLRDGTTYFVLLTALHIVFVVCSLKEIFGGTAYLVWALIPITTSRFILNLRSVHYADQQSEGLRPSFVAATGASLRFASATVKTMGAPLRHPFEDDLEDILDLDDEADDAEICDGAPETGADVVIADDLGIQEVPRFGAGGLCV